MLYLEGEDQIKFYKHFLLKGSIRKSLGKDSEVNILLQLQAFKGLGSTKRYLEWWRFVTSISILTWEESHIWKKYTQIYESSLSQLVRGKSHISVQEQI